MSHVGNPSDSGGRLSSLSGVNDPKALPLMERFKLGELTHRELTVLLRAEVYSGLETFCDIPRGYRHCLLGWKYLDIESMTSFEALEELLNNPPGEMVNPQAVQKEAVEFFCMLQEGDAMMCRNGDPMDPAIGAYFTGAPGCGKTHIMAAGALDVKRRIDERLAQVNKTLAMLIDDAYQKYIKYGGGRESESVGTVVNTEFGLMGAGEYFERQVKFLKERLASFPVQPTDFLYMGFDKLCEIFRDTERRKRAFEAIERARFLFIDDLHPRNDPERQDIAQHLLERRYEIKRGGTYFTSNLEEGELGGTDKRVAERLTSRAKEMFVHFDFKDCKDWRQEVFARRGVLIHEELRRRIQAWEEGHSEPPFQEEQPPESVTEDEPPAEAPPP